MLDATVFRRFDDAGCLILLPPYFQKRKVRAEIVREVENELVDASKAQTLNNQGWPHVVELPAELRGKLFELARASQGENDGPKKNFGEISTALYADHVGDALFIGEDQLAKSLCIKFGVDRISTAQLVVEMLEEGYLDYQYGWRVWDMATPEKVGREEFHRSLADRGLRGLICPVD